MTTGLEISARERTLELTLANPPDNRLTTAMVDALDQALDQFASDAFDVLLLRGAGRSFSKGFDVPVVRTPQGPSDDLRPTLLRSNAVFSRLSRSPKLTVAALHGACLGGGLELALACHFRLCEEKTRLGLPEVWINLVPGLGGIYRLTLLVGQAKALELIALGDLISAEEALRLNLVNRVLPKEGFADRVGSFIKALRVADQRVVQEIIRLVSLSADAGEEDCVRQSLESFARLFPCTYQS